MNEEEAESSSCCAAESCYAAEQHYSGGATSSEAAEDCCCVGRRPGGVLMKMIDFGEGYEDFLRGRLLRLLDAVDDKEMVLKGDAIECIFSQTESVYCRMWYIGWTMYIAKEVWEFEDCSDDVSAEYYMEHIYSHLTYTTMVYGDVFVMMSRLRHHMGHVRLVEEYKHRRRAIRTFEMGRDGYAVDYLLRNGSLL